MNNGAHYIASEKFRAYDLEQAMKIAKSKLLSPALFGLISVSEV